MPDTASDVAIGIGSAVIGSLGTLAARAFADGELRGTVKGVLQRLGRLESSVDDINKKLDRFIEAAAGRRRYSQEHSE
jgi:hypothetical protein